MPSFIEIKIKWLSCKILDQALLEQSDIDINLPDSQGRTALMYAISSANQSILRWLLSDERTAINQQDAQVLATV